MFTTAYTKSKQVFHQFFKFIKKQTSQRRILYNIFPIARLFPTKVNIELRDCKNFYMHLQMQDYLTSAKTLRGV